MTWQDVVDEFDPEGSCWDIKIIRFMAEEIVRPRKAVEVTTEVLEFIVEHQPNEGFKHSHAAREALNRLRETGGTREL